MNIFDILGPIMVGPSSSHTAGAVRIGLIGRQLIGRTPVKAEIYLHGSFADTGHGHGTDRAIVAGLLGMKPDDGRIPFSYEVAKEKGMEFTMETKELRGVHPNTAELVLYNEDGSKVTVQASSIGGGRINVHHLDGVPVNFSGEQNTLIVHNNDQPGLASEVTSLLAFSHVNIASLQLFRERRGGHAVMIAEIDEALPREAMLLLQNLNGVHKAIYISVKP